MDTESEKLAAEFKRPLALFHDFWNMGEDVRIQETIWHVEMGPGKRMLLWLTFALLTLAVGLLYGSRQFRGLEHRESMEMAQLARNISRGQGFTTYVIRPLSLWQLEKHAPNDGPRLGNHPDLHSPPLYPLALAVLFAPFPSWMFQYQPTDILFLPERWLILPFNYLCLFASLLLVHFWTRRLFPTWVAITAPLLLLFSDHWWGFAISGLPTCFLVLLFLSSIHCLWRADQLWHPLRTHARTAVLAKPSSVFPNGWYCIAASAVLFGLCFLTQYNTVLLLPALLIYAASICLNRRDACRCVAIFAALYALIIAPWLLRNHLLSHSLLGVATYDFLNGVLPSHYHPNLDNLLDLTAYGRRFFQQSRSLLFDLPRLIGSEFLVVFFAVGLLYHFANPTTVRLRRAVWIGLACATLGLSLFPMETDTGGGLRGRVQAGNLFILFLPLVAAYGVSFFYLLLNRIAFPALAFPARLLRMLVIAIFLLVNAAALLLTLNSGQRPTYPYPPYHPPCTAMVANQFTKDTIGASDLPWAMAWVGDRRTVWLPTLPADLAKIQKSAKPTGGLSFLLLTPHLLDQRFQTDLIKGEFAAWRLTVEGKIPEGCAFTEMRWIPPGRDQILFTIHPKDNE